MSGQPLDKMANEEMGEASDMRAQPQPEEERKKASWSQQSSTRDLNVYDLIELGKELGLTGVDLK